ncbi:MAG: DNA topoisomerase I [Candidatus Nealsonbacteria bacterium RIFCSPLOWO2_01_FULL_43_32]|uniref:DNA topoisomerase 1 n=1 Tax=Candidatus Nealsonbacteria bacterium RIFCSPLOWO2_01_FULL_43_32 TaxID=1801672 RepID=A0A1G2EEL1_9BACT|nr:MAG: DNA topoisomerase I [Candidatus Nealsonbacteria bacterium RIFCSPLOWO2_01_FULL_43_32]
MKLVVVESPVKSKTIQGFLGPKYRVLSSYGHVRDLPKSELGVDVENDFQPKYIIPLKARKVIQLLKNEVKRAELTIIATDEDREGEAIAWHLAQVLDLENPKSEARNPKPYERIVFHEITKPAIENALESPRKIDMNLVDAQQARRVLDRIVGYKLSPFLWKKVARGLSAGRVQSVAVKLIVEREREIEKFKTQEYWSIEALLRSRKTEFSAFLSKKDGLVLDKLAIKTKDESEKIVQNLKNAEYKVENIEKKEVNKNPLGPLTTSTLQQEAFKKFRYSGKQTMRIAQNLYERGLITYHRTDSLNLSDLALSTAQKFIIENYGEAYHQFRKFKTKSKGAQEAHEAIRPAYPDKNPEQIKTQAKLDNNQYKLYDLIWRRFIACQMKAALFDSTTIDVSAKNYVFRANGQTLKFDGFLKVYPMKIIEATLPLLKRAETLTLIKLTPLQHFTQPPGRFSEATLIKALEIEGIGRPSTYAPIISTIQERNYVEKDDEKRFKPTEIGLVVNDILVAHFPEIVDIKFTANMEENLDNIAQGQRKWKNIVKEFYGHFSHNLEKKYQEVSKKEFTEKPTGKKCPKCQAPLLVRLGKFGKFYACSKFPKCRYTESLPENTLNIKCPKCKEGQIVEKRTRKNKIFYGCNKFPDCDFALWDKPLPGRQAGTGQTCPECGSLLVEKNKKISCSNKTCASFSKK